MRRKVVPLFLVLVLLVTLSACATYQDKWNKLTPGEQARVVIGGFQDQLGSLFDNGKAYVVARPELQARWKAQAIPLFDQINRSLAATMSLAQQDKITPDQVYAQVQPLVNQLLQLLIQMGVLK